VENTSKYLDQIEEVSMTPNNLNHIGRSMGSREKLTQDTLHNRM